MIVIDASVLANALTDDGPIGEAARGELGRDDHWAAPEHLRVEVFSAVRGLALGGKIGPARAAEALDALAEVEIEPIATAALLQRMWALRNHAGGYDGGYVAAAEAIPCPLVTADARLARTRALRCEIRLALP